MIRKTAIAACAVAWLLWPGAQPAVLGQPLEGSASAVISVLAADWPDAFRAEWQAKERAVEDELRKSQAEQATEHSERITALRKELAEEIEELREDFREEADELRDDFREKRDSILSSRDDPEDKQAALSDLDDDFYEERDDLEEEQRQRLAELQQSFDDKAADLMRERDLAQRTAVRDARGRADDLEAQRKEALVRLHLDRLRAQALAAAVKDRGIDPAGDPVIAQELAERLGSRAVFSESATEAEGASRIRLEVAVRVSVDDYETVVGQWGLLIPPEPITLRFSGWNGDPRPANEAIARLGSLARDPGIEVDGSDIVVDGASYLPAAKVAERLNRIRLGDRELRAVVEDSSLRVTPFP